jgi:hypothetical protein
VLIFRKEIHEYLIEKKISLKYFNGGGSATALKTV